MAQQRSRLNFVFRPKGDEQSLSFGARARFAMLGANGVTEITPQSNRALYGLLEQVSEKAGMATPKAYIWQSKKPIANAVAMPTATPTIAFSEKITELLQPEELAAVAGHELGHVKNMSHSGKLYWLSALGGLALGEVIGRPLQRQIRGQMEMGNRNVLLGIADVAVTTGRIIAPAVGAAVASRSEEYAADRHGAMAMGGDAVPLLSGLQKLGEYNQQQFRPTVLSKILAPVSHLTRSHPEYEQRRNALGVSPQQVADYRATQHPNATMSEPTQHAAAVKAQRGESAGKSAESNWAERVGDAEQRQTEQQHSR